MCSSSTTTTVIDTQAYHFLLGALGLWAMSMKKEWWTEEFNSNENFSYFFNPSQWPKMATFPFPSISFISLCWLTAEAEIEVFHLLVHSAKMVTWHWLDQAEVRSLELHPDLPVGWQEPKYLCHPPLLSHPGSEATRTQTSTHKQYQC